MSPLANRVATAAWEASLYRFISPVKKADPEIVTFCIGETNNDIKREYPYVLALGDARSIDDARNIPTIEPEDVNSIPGGIESLERPYVGTTPHHMSTYDNGPDNRCYLFFFATRDDIVRFTGLMNPNLAKGAVEYHIQHEVNETFTPLMQR